MKYKCKKCGELYDIRPEECDYDSEREFEETELCQSCEEYKPLYGGYCMDCIKEAFTERMGLDYIKYLDERRSEWGLEPFFRNEYLFLSEKEKSGKNFLWEYCIKDPEGLAEYIFKSSKMSRSFAGGQCFKAVKGKCSDI